MINHLRELTIGMEVVCVSRRLYQKDERAVCQVVPGCVGVVCGFDCLDAEEPEILISLPIYGLSIGCHLEEFNKTWAVVP